MTIVSSRAILPYPRESGIVLEEAKDWRAKFSQIHDINPPAVHDPIFVIGTEGLYADKYREGPLSNLPIVGLDFLGELSDCPIRNDLTQLLGLQACKPPITKVAIPCPT